MIIEILLGFMLVFVIYIINKKPPNLPPGIWGWPIFGSLPSQEVSLVEQVRDYSKIYGNIFTWRIGGNIYIFLCNYDIIKTALNRPELSDRPALYTFDVFTNFVKLGLSNSNGKTWQINRRFALRHLKSLGMGKTTYESVIQDEVACLIKDFGNHVDGPPNPIPWSLNVAILNVIWRITADRHYEVDDEEFHHFNKLIDDLFSDVGPLLALYDLIPWLHKVIPKAVNRWCGVDDFVNIYEQLKVFFMKIIEDHQRSLDTENPRDYIDHYLIEMEAQSTNPESHLSILDLLMGLADLFIAGSETSSSTLRWIIFYLGKYPDLQEKVQKELDSVVPRGTPPSLEHRQSLPYLEAFSLEVQRVICLVALSLPHAASQETSLNGYVIPKGAVIVPNLECCHYDPAYWKKPNDFYPENFLDSEGKVLNKKEGFLPFSIGKRVCPGESLANMEIFLFMAGMVQNFTFTIPDGEDLNPKRNPKNRIVNTCKPFNVIIQTRE